MNKTRWLLLVAISAVIVAAPFFLTVAGDGQVHLAIADNFAHGRAFQYNPNGEIVVASTSPFWTILLTALIALTGPAAPWLLKLIVVGIWLAAAWLLWRIAKEGWQLNGGWLWGTLALWLAHATIVANALGGLENVLSAMQLLWIGLLTIRWGRQLTWGRSAGLGLILGWAILTRPDGGLFALILLGLFGLALWLVWRESLGRVLAQFIVMATAAAIVLLPWYAYQFSITGNFVTDSSVARLYNGRQGSLALIPDLLYLHPKPLLSLGSAFLPLGFGFLIASGNTLKRMASWRANHQASTTFARVSAVTLVICGMLFFTFVVGAEAFGRYFLPLYPFFFLAGVEGLRLTTGWLKQRRPRLAQAFVALVVLFMVATSAADYARRVGPGRFTVETPLDVIYGPAHTQYLSFNVPQLPSVPADRAALTDEFLASIGASAETDHTSIAVTEVQLRYYLDERVDVLSLDGRTSADILTFTNPTTGVPDFPAYFLAVQPDYVHVNQWCEVGGWLAALFTSEIEENLVCTWQKQTAEMALGDSFEWQGMAVTLVADEIVRIDWE